MTPHHATIYSLRLVKEHDITYFLPHRQAVACTQKAANLVAQLLANVDREHFVICLFDAKRRLTGVHTAHVGTLTSSTVHPREVYKVAILTNADSIILAHNHPSGDIQPSREDKAITKRLILAGQTLGIPILDHIIVGFPPELDHFVYFSFAEESMLHVESL